jgi:hypothetical protein
VTISAMKAGSGPLTGGVELPGSALQFVPHAGAWADSAKPLKLLGAGPPLKLFFLAHWAHQDRLFLLREAT